VARNDESPQLAEQRHQRLALLCIQRRQRFPGDGERIGRGFLRQLLARGGAQPDVRPLRELAASRLAQLTITDDGQVEVEDPGRSDVADGLFRLLLIMRVAQEDGTWSRLRVCANDECRWAFYDRSRNQQGNWCDMAVCGNRLKNRQLRARKRR